MAKNNVNAIRFDREKSQSWIIAVEALVLGVTAGYKVSESGAHDAVAFGSGVVAFLAIYGVIVYVPAIFWLWTLALSGLVAGWTFDSLRGSGVDQEWALLWSGVAFLFVVGIHVKSRIHNLAENTSNRITEIQR